METLKLKFKIIKADTILSRFLGFMFKPKADYGIVFFNCRSVHTFFMRFNLDILYLDNDNRVLKIKKDLSPWKIAKPVKNSSTILEIPSNLTDTSLLLGKRIEF